MGDLMFSEAIITIVAFSFLLVLGVAFWIVARRKKTERLRERFGPEYDNAVKTHHNRQRAEAELSQREKRVRNFNIVTLPRAERERYQTSWLEVQSRFVDEPVTALVNAHQLVQEVMRRCGYPMADFEQSAADISVDHPHVVDNFRAATRIAERSERSAVSTEELRQALVHYRALFQDLLQFDEQHNSSIKPTERQVRKGKSAGVQPSH